MCLLDKGHSVYLLTLEPGLKGEMIPLYSLLSVLPEYTRKSLDSCKSFIF